MRWFMLTAIVSLVLASCAAPTPTPTPTATPTPTLTPTPLSTATPTPTPTTATPSESDETDALRELAFAYWEAFNSYDADKVLEYLEDAYRQERESRIRGDIGRIKLFRVKLGVSEETPPRMTGPGEGEMYLTMKEPIGTRRIHMRFLKVEGEWKITYSQEVE